MIKQIRAIGYRGISDLQRVDPDDYYARCWEYYTKNYKGMPYDFTREGAYSIIARTKQGPDLIEEK
ncbi:MAG: hypothetical protein JW762_05725 [Dehalococcoidales bacterium]|nr:hypothetical protein [Dehalococcoidales bacterium]